MEISDFEIKLLERVVRLEERIIASDKALDLARGSLSKANAFSIATVIMSMLALLSRFIK